MEMIIGTQFIVCYVNSEFAGDLLKMNKGERNVASLSGK